MLFGLVLWIPLGFIFGAKISELQQVFGYAVLSAILSEAFVFYAFSKGNLSVTTTLIATYPIYTLLFSYIINNEVLTSMQLVFVILTILGTVLTCVEKEFSFKLLKNKVVIIPILSAMAIGLSDTLTKQIIDKTSSFSFLVAIAIVQIPVALIYLLITKQKIKNIFSEMKIEKQAYKYGVLGALLNIIATGLLLISFNYTYASIASPLSAIYTPIVLLYSFIFMREKLLKINYLGLAITLVGTLGILFLG